MTENKIKNNTTKKIIFIGLDNGGKTSIVLSLKGLNLMSLKSSNPTRGIETSNLNINDEKFNIWDFGGQEQYRNIHLEDFKKNFWYFAFIDSNIIINKIFTTGFVIFWLIMAYYLNTSFLLVIASIIILFIIIWLAKAFYMRYNKRSKK